MRLLPAMLVCALVLSATGSSAQTPAVAGSHALATGFFDDAAFGSSDAPVWFRRLYIRHGEAAGIWLSGRERARRVVRAAMMLAINRKARGYDEKQPRQTGLEA